MQRFMAGEGLSHRLSLTLRSATAIVFGVGAGWLWGRYHWQTKQDWCNDKHITPYQCQDQVNKLIEDTGKPAVIYYYLPMTSHHYHLRRYMFKYSHEGHESAHFVMVNLTKKLQMAKEALTSAVYPLSMARIEVRYPKCDLAIFEPKDKDGYHLINETNDNRREMFSYDTYQEEFRAFLEENQIVRGADPVDVVLQTTRKAIFSDL